MEDLLISTKNASRAFKIEISVSQALLAFSESRAKDRCSPNAERRMNLKRMLIAAVVISLTALAGCAANDPSSALPEKLVVAGISLDSTKETFESYDAFVQELERELGIPVEYYPTDSGSAVAEAAISGRVDIALLSPVGYLGVSKTVTNFDLIGVTLRLGATEPGYFAYGITPLGSQVQSLEDLAGQKVCFGDIGALTQDLLPTSALLEIGLETRFDRENDLERINMGSSSLAFGGVRDGDCVAGFGTDSFFEVLMPEQGLIDPSEYRVFWSSERIAGAPLVVRNDLPGSLTEQIKEVVLNNLNKSALVDRGICTTEEDCNYLASNLWGFVEADPSEYAFIQEACQQTGYEICQ
jgi:phosphonate transport system substrate-binding protein